jgi:osmotically-inducible protein OsmY
VLLCALFVSAATLDLRAEQPTAQIKRDVERILADDRDLRGLEVSVVDSEVTLTGSVPTFWVKSEAIRKSLGVAGVETVVSELEVPAAEDDNALAPEVVDAVLGYPYYTMFDFISIGLNQGDVVLTGSVTPDFDKTAALFERVAKVPGVQYVQTDIEILPVSGRDAELRAALAARIFRHNLFQRYANSPRPPFHVIVRGGSVTLAGEVRGELEKLQLVLIARQTSGVLRVTDELQLRR